LKSEKTEKTQKLKLKQNKEKEKQKLKVRTRTVTELLEAETLRGQDLSQECLADSSANIKTHFPFFFPVKAFNS